MKKYQRVKKRLRLSDPKWTYALDKNTIIPKVKLCYTIPYERNKLGDNVIRYKNTQEYIKNRDINDYDLLIMKNELIKYHEQITNEQNRLLSGMTDDDDGIDYWVKEYIQRNTKEM